MAKPTYTTVRIHPDPTLVLARPFLGGDVNFGGENSRLAGIVARIAALDPAETQKQAQETLRLFDGRHRQLEKVWEKHAQLAEQQVPAVGNLNEASRKLVGMTFTQEVAVAAAALTNPSAVPVGDEETDGSQRFVMSLRAIGEGHVSSVMFRNGTITAAGEVTIDDAGDWLDAGETRFGVPGTYVVDFDDVPLAERILYPKLGEEAGGMEDARFVRFRGEDDVRYLATYTAYDRHSTTVRLLETEDFRRFRSAPLTGEAAQSKGLAIFPRKIGGSYWALGRGDNESNFVISSEDLTHWEGGTRISRPRHAWEVAQGGNNGSPIETEAGWLVLTHGVGPMRRYVLSAMLLDLDDPTQVIGELHRPLLEPQETERDGYVPNVVYSCGGFAHRGTLVLPYGCSDRGVGIATFNVTEILDSIC